MIDFVTAQRLSRWYLGCGLVAAAVFVAAQAASGLPLLSGMLALAVLGLGVSLTTLLHERDARATRERILRRALSALADATDHDGVCQAGADAAHALAANGERLRASLILGSGNGATVFATSGQLPSKALETTFALEVGGGRVGELVVQSGRALSDEVKSALMALGSHVVLALESRTREKALGGERTELEDEIVRRAHVDQLTGLPNRTYFLERVMGALERLGRSGEPVSVLLINLDDFKTVNDTLGHVAGDELLRGVSDRLLASIRADDMLARLGSDEWAILIEESPPESPSAVADRIITSLERAFVLLGQHEVFAHASIGSATVAAEHDDIDAAELLRNAEVAMYHAKQQGRTGFEAFEPAMRVAVAERLALKAELERAVSGSEFILHYQPIVLLDSGEITGLEALIRWQHPERGMIPPFHFIPLAEETGLIVPIGRFVLLEALRAGREWQQIAGANFVMSVNLSARQLDHATLVEDVQAAVDETGIDPSTVILEITETALMEDVEAAIARLGELKRLGVQLAIDDFGTGYSSLQYLRQFPADIIKVAKPFVDGVVTRGSDEYRIADAIVRLGETFNLRALAEGIELAEQREMLRELRCELGQGYLFAKPLEPSAVTELLRDQQSSAIVTA
jgi:diguanylate cyclase (GGDEF)-like protein